MPREIRMPAKWCLHPVKSCLGHRLDHLKSGRFAFGQGNETSAAAAFLIEKANRSIEKSNVPQCGKRFR
jgi:hypothetical protein